MRKIGIGELRLLLMSREFLEPLARWLAAGEADYMIPFLVELAEDDNDLLPHEPELFIAREEFRKALSRYLPDWVQVVALRNGFNREGWLALAALKDGEGLVDVLRQIAGGAKFRTLNGKAREVWRRPSTRERTNAAVALRQIAEGAEFRTLDGKARTAWRHPSSREQVDAARWLADRGPVVEPDDEDPV